MGYTNFGSSFLNPAENDRLLYIGESRKNSEAFRLSQDLNRTRSSLPHEFISNEHGIITYTSSLQSAAWYTKLYIGGTYFRLGSQSRYNFSKS